jgi:hypothetical protein
LIASNPNRAKNWAAVVVSLRQPAHVVELITGHLSRRMLEHYSDVRLKAKRRLSIDSMDWVRLDRLRRQTDRRAKVSATVLAGTQPAGYASCLDPDLSQRDDGRAYDKISVRQLAERIKSRGRAGRAKKS